MAINNNNPLNLPQVDPNDVFGVKQKSKDLTSKKEECNNRGGAWFWSEEKNACVQGTSPKKELELFGTPQEQEANLQKEKEQASFGVLKDETGRLSGFTRGDQTLLGLPPSEVRALAEKEAGLQELEVGGQAETVLSNREQQQEGLRAAAGIEQTPLNPLAAAENIELNYVSAALSALPGILPDVFQGAFYGAGIGATAGGIAGAVGGPAGVAAGAAGGATYWAIRGAVLGGVKGFYQDFIGNLEQQRSEAIEAPIRTLTETKPLLSDIINAQNTNPEDRQKHIQQFNIQTQLIQDDYDNLKDLTDSSLTALLGENGINQLKEFKVYYSGEAQQLEFEFADALANPDPSKIRATSEDIEKMKTIISNKLKITGVV